MYARVAWFQGEPSDLKDVAEGIRRDSESGPPEGVPAKEFLLLGGRDSDKMIAIAFFETEDDLRQGDETLNAMNPPHRAGGTVQRAGVEMFEVAVHMKA
jgi:hypothetical protein